jgi:hypothetical protein
MGYQQVQNKPTAAFALSLVAGIFGLLGSLAVVGVFGYVLANLSGAYLGQYGDLVTGAVAVPLAIGIWCLISAILVLAGAARIRSHPTSHTKWGVIILIFSIIGLGPLALAGSAFGYVLTYFGFDIIGIVLLIISIITALLGFIGGILAIVFKPQFVAGYPPQGYPQQGYMPQQPTYYPQQQPQYYPQQQPTQATRPQQITRICPNCGRVIDENQKFCPYCGKQLG